MENKKAKIQDIVVQFFLYVLVFGICFLGSIFLINALLESPNQFVEGTSPITFLNLTIAEQTMQKNGDSWDIIIIKNSIYYYLPFIIAIVLFLVCLVVLGIGKQLLRRVTV